MITNNNSKFGGKFYRKQQFNNHKNKPNGYCFGDRSSAAATPEKSGRSQHPHRAWSESDGLDRCGDGAPQHQKSQQKVLLLPPPPVPYYCAAEAAASGFMQFVHKSPSGWWTREKNRHQTRRIQSNSHQKHKTTPLKNHHHRSASVGGNGYSSNCCTTSDGDDSDDSGSGSGSNFGDGGSNSDEQDSDGEFIGALAAAAVVGHDPNREWAQQGASGDPIADWDCCYSDSEDSATETIAIDGEVEWTTEIVATDLRHGCPYRNGTFVG